MLEQAPRRHRLSRWASASLAALAVVVIAVIACEAAGWPFLAQPLQRVLSRTLDRRVVFSEDSPLPEAATAPSVDGSAHKSFRIHFFGHVRVEAPYFEIAAPSWSQAAHMVQARDVDLTLRYRDLWAAYSGRSLRIERLSAAMLDADLERRKDGRASWQFGAPKTTAPTESSPPPLFEKLEVLSGSVRYRDEPLALTAQTKLSLGDDGVLRADGTGSYGKWPIKIAATAQGALPFSAQNSGNTAIPLTIDASIGRAAFSFKGQTEDAMHLQGFSGHFSLQGPSLAAVGDPLHVTLPTTSKFSIAGWVVKQDQNWRVRVDDAKVGTSLLNGAFSYEAGHAVPLLAGKLGGRRLLLADLGPAVGTQPKTEVDGTPARPGRVLPERPFDLSALRKMDANVLIDIAEVDLGTHLLEPLRPLRGHLRLNGGVLDISSLEARTDQGRLTGEIKLDGRSSVALMNTDLKWSDVRLEQWLHLARAPGSPPYISGRLGGSARLSGRGRSTAEILGSLNGRAHAELHDGTISHLIVEASGLDLAQGLGMLVKGDDSLPVQCGVADLNANAGIFRPRAMVIDTSDSTVWVDGRLSLADETMDLRAVVSPKDFSPLALRTPIRVKGTLGKPDVSLEKGPLARKVGESLLLGLLNPLAAILPLIDLGDPKAAQHGDVGCQALVERATRRHSPPTTAKKH